MNFIKEHFEHEGLWNKKPDELNKNRIETLFSMLPDDTETILDVGCGNGIFVNFLQKQELNLKRIHGVDQSERALKFVNTEKSKGTIDNLNFKDREFNAVSCLEVLEHLPKEVYKDAISELARVAKKYIIISVPNNEKLEARFIKCPDCKTEFHFTNHLRDFDENKMKNLFNDYGFVNKIIFLGGENIRFKYITPIKRIIKRIKKKKLQHGHSVHCPACGNIMKPNHVNVAESEFLNRPNDLSLIKKLWPKYFEYNWIFALYIKNESEIKEKQIHY